VALDLFDAVVTYSKSRLLDEELLDEMLGFFINVGLFPSDLMTLLNIVICL